MRIKFVAPDPRAGVVAQMDSHRGQQLIDSGAAVQVKDNAADADAAAPASSPAPTPAPMAAPAPTSAPAPAAKTSVKTAAKAKK